MYLYDFETYPVHYFTVQKISDYINVKTFEK